MRTFFKIFSTSALLVFFATAASAQEICDNGIDDDADMLVDLNDPDCDCQSAVQLSSLFPNPSFEDYNCLPTTFSQLNCADTWQQATSATSDYLYDGQYVFPAATAAGLSPPPDGSGFVGAIFSEGYKEYIGACLSSPMLGGTDYNLSFNVATTPVDGSGNVCNGGVIDYTPVDITIYGSPTCNLPVPTQECPTSADPQWQPIGTVTYNPQNSWQLVSIVLSPTVDIYAVMIGAPCTLPPEYNIGFGGCYPYFYFDSFGLFADIDPLQVTSSGSLCTNDLVYTADSDTSGGTWQWYLDGVALIGETDSIINIGSGPFGTYTVQYQLDTLCTSYDIDLTAAAAPTADFNFSDVCEGVAINFTDQSTQGGTPINTWEWDFDNGDNSSAPNPVYFFQNPGQYDVELIVTDQSGCSDTVVHTVDIAPSPIADFEYIVDGLSSEAGGSGGCINSTVFLNDTSTIDNPGNIISWDWDFGDGNTSTQQNPSHTYSTPGSYGITLTVESDGGCTSTIELVINMYENNIGVLSNNPTCYQFTDGSITLQDTVGGISNTFEITDSLGNILNVGGSNTANNLGEGWYYLSVASAGGCSYSDSIFIDDPGPLSATVDVTDVLCNGDATGSVIVSSVTNYGGSYDQIAFFWNPGVGDEGIGADSVYNIAAGNYVLTINDENGCSNTVDFVVNEPSPLVLDYGAYPAFCRTFASQTANGVVWASANGGAGNHTYLWTNLQDSSTSVNTTWGANDPGDYFIIATDGNGCTVTATVTIDEVAPEADFSMTSPEFTIDYEGTAPVTVTFQNESLYYVDTLDPVPNGTVFWTFDYPNMPWVPGDPSPYDTTYAVGGTYTVCIKVINKFNCADSLCKEIVVHEPLKFDPVNVFTPGSDGANDVFTFTFLAEGVETFACTIVNRWGRTIREFGDINDFWDGTDASGSECKDGVYFYVYEGTAENGEPFQGQGTITLIRQ